MMHPETAIIGLGAIGIMYASRFADAYGDDSVTVIADHERIERYRQEGVYANGRKYSFRYAAPDEAAEADLLLFAVKNYTLEAALPLAEKACGPDTIVLSLLNGVTSEETIAKALHPAHLLYCTVQGMDATRTGRSVAFTQFGNITLGEKDNRRTPALEKAVFILKGAGIETVVPDDMIKQMWNKWMLNCGVNQACATAGCGYGGVQKGGAARDTMIAAMNEALTAARLEGIDLTEADRDAWYPVIESLDPSKEPSMRQDTKAGRRNEVDCFAGLVRSICAAHGVPTPVNDQLYDELSEMNRQAGR